MLRTALLTALLTASMSLFIFGLPLVTAAEQPHGSTNGHETEVHDAHAGQHGAHGPLHLTDVLTNMEFIGSVVNFAVLLAIFIYFGRKPLQEFLQTRRKAVQEGMAEAARQKQQAEAKYKEYDERLQKLDDEIKRLTDSIIQAAQEEKIRIIEEAEKRAKRLREDTDRLIEQQMKQLQADVMQEVVDTSIKTAESVLSETLNAQDHQKLASDYVVQLTKKTKPQERA